MEQDRGEKKVFLLLLFCRRLKMENYWCPTLAPNLVLQNSTLFDTHTHTHTAPSNCLKAAAQEVVSLSEICAMTLSPCFYLAAKTSLKASICFCIRKRLFIPRFIIKGGKKRGHISLNEKCMKQSSECDAKCPLQKKKKNRACLRMTSVS